MKWEWCNEYIMLKLENPVILLQIQNIKEAEKIYLKKIITKKEHPSYFCSDCSLQFRDYTLML